MKGFIGFNLFLEGVVRSKISRGYVEGDSLEETLLFTRSKSDKNWSRTGGYNTTLADLKAKRSFLTIDVREPSTESNSSRRNVSTNRITLVSSKKAKKYERAMLSAKQQLQYILILGRPTSLMSNSGDALRKQNLSGNKETRWFSFNFCPILFG